MTRGRRSVVTGRPARTADPRVGRAVARLAVGTVEQRRVRAAGLTPTLALGDALADETVRLLRVDLDRAECLAEALSWLAPRLGRQYVGKASRLRGHVEYQRGRYGLALRRYASAARTLDAVGLEVERASVLMAAVNALSHVGRYDEALVRAREARRIFLAHGDRLRAARMDANVAMMLFRRDRPEASLRLGQRALTVFEQLGAVEDVAITRLNTAARLTAVHAFSRAMALYARTRAYCSRHRLHLLALESDGNLAYLHAQQGEYSRALALYGRVRVRAESAGYHTLAATILLDEAELLVELNADRRAESLAGDALARADAHEMRYESAKANTVLGICAARQDRVEEALHWFGLARRGFELEGNASRVALADLHRAVLLARHGVAPDAADCATQARTALRAQGLGAKVALADLVLARTSLALGDLAVARQHLGNARGGLRRHPSPALAYQAAFLCGEVEYADGRRRHASRWYRRAYGTLNGLWSQLGVEELRIAFLDDKAVVHQSVVRSLLERAGRPDHAAVFAVVQHAKSRALAELLAGGTPDSSAGIPGVGRLRGALNAAYREIDRLEGAAAPPAPRQLARWRSRARETEQRLSRVIYEAQRRSPRSASLFRDSVPLREVQASLGSAVLLEYFEVRGSLHVLVADRTRVSVTDLGPLERLRQPIRLCLFNLTAVPRVGMARGAVPHGTAAVATHLRALYDGLLAPVISRIAQGQPMVIAPHGPLHRVPFHALLGEHGYLGERSPVTLAPNGSVFAWSQRRRAARGRGALVMALPDRRAPAIGDEARVVAAQLEDALLLVGASATEKALRTLGRDRRVVHIATHGFYRDENPMFSSFRLANTRIDVQSLYGLRFRADLVTLSGCSTGVSTVAGGDELVGLARGLLHAGAACVHLSLWDVDDASTRQYMEAFYAQYAAGHTPAEASRRAAAAIRAHSAHPFHWAPFVVIGRGV